MNTENWAIYNLNTIFNIEYGSKLDIIKMEENPYSDIAFVTRTATNNGITMFVNEYTDKKPYSAGIMTIALGGSIGKTFIQPFRFYTCQNVAVLLPKIELSIYHKIFLKTIIEKECETKFVAFGRELNSHIRNDFFLKLPTANGQPDWQWMEEYVKNVLLPKLPENARQVWEKRYNNKPLSSQKLELKTDEWKWFRYDEIFEIKKGFFNKKPEESGLGTIPFIGATDSNNGVTSWYTKDEIDSTPKAENTENVPLNEKMFESPCITVSNNGSVGYAFYQSQPFTCSHDVNPLYLRDKNVNLSPSLALFLCGVIECEQFRWTYGRKWRPERMPQSLIKQIL